MGLLWVDYELEYRELAEKAFECQRTAQKVLFDRMTRRRYNIIHRDTRYNVDFLYTAYMMKDAQILNQYMLWVYQMMVSIFKDKSKEDVCRYTVGHLGFIREAVQLVVSDDKKAALDALLAEAQDYVTAHADESVPLMKKPSRYEKEIETYMQSLFERNSRRSFYLVDQFAKTGIPINDIYVEILAESMRRVGELWHTMQITVDEEHYCTSVTQMVMSQLYPIIFEKERKNKLILCACPGSELHEMGARMLTDVFENEGWDSMYLGAAVPVDALLSSIRENHPDLVALAVTMPQHLIECRELVEEIRKEFPQMKIAVGGRAFLSTQGMWKAWPIDYYAENANELLAQVGE